MKESMRVRNEWTPSHVTYVFDRQTQELGDLIGFVELSLTLGFVTARRSMVRLNASARSADSMPTTASTYPTLGLLETSSCGAMRAMRAWARGWSGERARRRLSVGWLVGWCGSVALGR